MDGKTAFEKTNFQERQKNNKTKQYKKQKKLQTNQLFWQISMSNQRSKFKIQKKALKLRV